MSTPSTGAVRPVPLDDEVDDCGIDGTREDKLTIDEVEQYDDVVCFLDEEQTPKIYAEWIERSR
jgi:hypothetical protein